MDQFKENSFSSTKDIENHGVLAFTFNKDDNDGTNNEYGNNTSKGMQILEQMNINPRIEINSVKVNQTAIPAIRGVT